MCGRTHAPGALLLIPRKLSEPACYHRAWESAIHLSCEFLTPLRLAAADYQQQNAADQTNSAKDRRKRNRVLLLGGRLNRTDIEDLLALGVSKSAIRQRDDTDGDKDDADYPGRLHD